MAIKLRRKKGTQIEPNELDVRRRDDGQWEIFIDGEWVLLSDYSPDLAAAFSTETSNYLYYDEVTGEYLDTGAPSADEGSEGDELDELLMRQAEAIIRNPPLQNPDDPSQGVDITALRWAEGIRAKAQQKAERRAKEKGKTTPGKLDIYQDAQGQFWRWSTRLGDYVEYDPPQPRKPIPTPFTEPEILEDENGRPWYRGGPGDDWRPYNPQQEKRLDIDQQIAKRLEEGDIAGAAALYRFKRQPTDADKLNKAMEIARSPADAMTLAAIQYGGLPIAGTPGTFGRIGPLNPLLQKAIEDYFAPLDLGTRQGRVIEGQTFNIPQSIAGRRILDERAGRGPTVITSPDRVAELDAIAASLNDGSNFVLPPGVESPKQFAQQQFGYSQGTPTGGYPTSQIDPYAQWDPVLGALPAFRPEDVWRQLPRRRRGVYLQ